MCLLHLSSPESRSHTFLISRSAPLSPGSGTLQEAWWWRLSELTQGHPRIQNDSRMICIWHQWPQMPWADMWIDVHGLTCLENLGLEKMTGCKFPQYYSEISKDSYTGVILFPWDRWGTHSSGSSVSTSQSYVYLQGSSEWSPDTINKAVSSRSFKEDFPEK